MPIGTQLCEVKIFIKKAKLFSGKCSSGGRKFFPERLINIIILSRGSNFAFSSKKQNCLVENAHVILHLQHCLEEKAQKIHARASVLTRQVDVLCEAEHAYRDTTLSR